MGLHRKRVVSRGHGISYLTTGGAPDTAVLIHGHLQAAEDWETYGYFNALLGSHRVVSVDMLGYGESDKPHDAEAHALDGRVRDVVAVLDAEGVDTAVVWGYSLGVFVAEAFAKQHPRRTVAYVAGGNLVGLTAHDRDNITRDGAAVLERSGVRAVVNEWPFMTDDAKDIFVRRNDARAAAAAARGCALAHAAEGEPLPGKTYNYVGTAEPWFDVAEAVAAERGVRFAAIPGADHAQAFRRSDVVVPLVLEFLAAGG
jgi:pimeloyl-ACP methyl ester carboxylesterase